jgi:hypothetical protein
MRQRVRRWAAVASLAGTLLGAPARAAVELDLAGGHGSERLAWSIGLAPRGPNVLSELTFQRTTTTAGGAKIRWSSERRSVTLQLDGRVGVLNEGTVRDDDFARNDRQGLFSRSVSRIDGNALLDLGIRTDFALLRGSRTAVNQGGLWLGGGWRFSQQTWRIVQGQQLFPRQVPLDPRLNSTYRARWMGPEIALLIRVPIARSLMVQSEFIGWPVLWYEGQGSWNLRRELRQDPSFRHEAHGYGMNHTLELRYWWRLPWDEDNDARAFLGLGWQWQWMATKRGIDTVFLQNGSQTTITFNGAERQGQYWFLTTGWTF